MSWNVEELLLRAALLAGYGPRAQPLVRRLAAATTLGAGRSCFEAGTPIQLTVDAPGPPSLRVGLSLGDRLLPQAIEDLVPAPALARLAQFLEPLPAADHAGLGVWLFWTETRQSIFVDLRDPSPEAALARLRCVLTSELQDRLERIRPAGETALPWSLRVVADDEAVRRIDVHWLVSRHASPETWAEAIAPGCWPRAIEALGHLLRWPGRSGRWVFVTPLLDEANRALRIGNSGWTLVVEDEAKHRAVGDLMSALGGPRDYAQALWSLCRGAASPAWRVGRACELTVSADETKRVRARLFFSPEVRSDC